VDDLSSAHVYLRLPKDSTLDDIPAETLEDCAQLVKANSIQGCKLSTVDVVYTPWANLRKTASMEVGQARPGSALCPSPRRGWRTAPRRRDATRLPARWKEAQPKGPQSPRPVWLAVHW